MAENATPTFQVPEKAQILLENYCYECHESGLAKGGVEFDSLADLGQGERLDLFNLALEHVFSGEMPPKDADQPREKDRQELMAWLWGELMRFSSSRGATGVVNFSAW